MKDDYLILEISWSSPSCRPVLPGVPQRKNNPNEPSRPGHDVDIFNRPDRVYHPGTVMAVIKYVERHRKVPQSSLMKMKGTFPLLDLLTR